MNIRLVRTLFLFLFAWMFLFPITTHAQIFNETLPTQSEVLELIKEPEPTVNIPGLNFSDTTVEQKTVGEGEDAVQSISLVTSYVGDYIGTIYSFSVIAISIIAVTMIAISGLQWSASLGNAQAINAAQERIKQAVIAIVLSAGSFVILWTVNPNLVTFKNLDIAFVPEDSSAQAGENVHHSEINPEFVSGSSTGSAVDCGDFEPSKPIAYPLVNTSQLGALDCGHIYGTRATSDITHIIIHEGKLGAGIAWWKHQKSIGKFGASTHFFIEPDGTIYQVMDIKYKAGHAGSINQKSIGIDLNAGCTTTKTSYEYTVRNCGYTEAQYRALRGLIDYLKEYTNVSEQHVQAHCEQYPDTAPKGHGDPRMFDWRKIGHNPQTHLNGVCAFFWGAEMGVRKGAPSTNEKEKELRALGPM
jgi:hypothetical protein